jgi:quinol-cytochrome oxidoreductase complex cytochrome b subunit
MRLVSQSPLLNMLQKTAIGYDAPSNLTYAWSFGIFSMLTLGIQFISGIFLSMHYIPEINYAFNSIEHIMRDVNGGWLFRYLHSNGASFFFICVYLHMLRSLWYGSFIYPRSKLWHIGVLIFFFMIVTAFLGYVLPWGQMSFWGVTVITNLLSIVPIYGDSLVIWIWGGHSVGQPTLNRFFLLHMLLAMIVLILVIAHLYVLHQVHSNNPLGIIGENDFIKFAPFFVLKDVLSIMGFFICFAYIVFFHPNVLGHPENYIQANPMLTPEHIVPEWYFLPFYAILRAMPDKVLGIVCMLASIGILFIIPYIWEGYESAEFILFNRAILCIWVISIILLAYIGMMPIEYPFNVIQYVAIYFYFFLPLTLTTYK